MVSAAGQNSSSLYPYSVALAELSLEPTPPLTCTPRPSLLGAAASGVQHQTSLSTAGRPTLQSQLFLPCIPVPSRGFFLDISFRLT